MQNFLRAYACKKLVRTANYGFASKWSGGEAVWIPGRKGGGRRGVIEVCPTGRNRRRSPAAFRLGIHPLATKP